MNKISYATFKGMLAALTVSVYYAVAFTFQPPVLEMEIYLSIWLIALTVSATKIYRVYLWSGQLKVGRVLKSIVRPFLIAAAVIFTLNSISGCTVIIAYKYMEHRKEEACKAKGGKTVKGICTVINSNQVIDSANKFKD
jgi:hypothetical protein